MPCQAGPGLVICSSPSREVRREVDGAVAWCFTCHEYRAFAWVVLDDGEYYGLRGKYECDRCGTSAVDFNGEPRFNLDDGGRP